MSENERQIPPLRYGMTNGRHPTMKSYLASLGILISCSNVKAYHAAGHLVAAQVVSERPLPLLDEMGEAL